MYCRTRTGPGHVPRPGAPATTSAPRSVSSAMSRPDFAFQRVAIVNRGEPAMRLINAVREWNAEGRPALRVIAVYTAADRHATFVREADESVLIGPAEADAAFEGSPYLDYAEVERRTSTRPGRRPRGGRIHRLPAHGQGDRGRRRPRHPPGPRARGPRGGVRAGQLGGVQDGRGRHGLPGAGHPRRPPCRGAGRDRKSVV